MRRGCRLGSTNCIDVCLVGRSVACGTEAPGVAPTLKYNWDGMAWRRMHLSSGRLSASDANSKVGQGDRNKSARDYAADAVAVRCSSRHHFARSLAACLMPVAYEPTQTTHLDETSYLIALVRRTSSGRPGSRSSV
jgi:hypothetical protein